MEPRSYSHLKLAAFLNYRVVVTSSIENAYIVKREISVVKYLSNDVVINTFAMFSLLHLVIRSLSGN